MRLELLFWIPLLAACQSSAPVREPAAQMCEERSVSAECRERIRLRCTAYLEELHEERNFPGCSAAVVLPDKTLVSLPIGFADLEAERAMLADDLLLSGSVGKTYVTAAAHKLMLAGKLKFDQRAIEFFNEDEWFLRVPNAETMTLQHLLRHQSGIARHVFKPEFLPDCFADPDRVWKPKELLAYIFDDEALFPAGSAWAYADTNYIVLGMIIERVAQASMYEYVRAEFLAPLGLEHTRPSDSRKIAGLTQGYLELFKGPGLPERALSDGEFFFNPQFEWCGGGFASSAPDLARWAHALYRGDAMEGDYLSSMLDAVPARLGPDKQYGLGVMIAPTELGQAIGHDGVMTGYGASVSHFPDHDLTVALQLNTDDPRVMGMPLDRVTLELAKLAVAELGE